MILPEPDFDESKEDFVIRAAALPAVVAEFADSQQRRHILGGQFDKIQAERGKGPLHMEIEANVQFFDEDGHAIRARHRY